MDQEKVKSNAEIRDAMMLYLTQVKKVNDKKLGFVASYIYSRGFLLDLKGIRERLNREQEQFYELDVLKGFQKPLAEDCELLGDELVHLIDNRVFPNFYDPQDPWG